MASGEDREGAETGEEVESLEEDYCRRDCGLRSREVLARAFSLYFGNSYVVGVLVTVGEVCPRFGLRCFRPSEGRLRGPV